MTVVTFGHGTATEDDLVRLLHGAEVASVVDVRSAPGSRRNPGMAKSAMQQWLPENGITYRWDRRLGGFRKVPPDSPDRVWRNEAFRGYANHMRTEEFLSGVRDVDSEHQQRTVAIMCAESVWWRCHRRMIADFLRAVRDIEVLHLMHDGTLREHAVTEGLRLREDGLVVYDGGQGSLM